MLNKKQYETPKNFNARQYLARKFKTNPETFYQWVFRHIMLKENMKVLEIGSGTGHFWLSNKDIIPKSWSITLTDYSSGMIENSKQNLKNSGLNFKFQVADAENLKFEKESFDLIIANLIMYHINDKNKALKGISNVLKKNGIFIASTFGKNDMIELYKILYEYLLSIGKILPERKNSFSLENGYDQLKPFFSKVKLLKYKNSLKINEAEPIINYFLSLNNISEGYVLLDKNEITGFRNILNEKLKKKSIIKVTKNTGMFYCEK